MLNVEHSVAPNGKRRPITIPFWNYLRCQWYVQKNIGPAKACIGVDPPYCIIIYVVLVFIFPVIQMCISQTNVCFLSEQSPKLCTISSTRLYIYHKHCASTKLRLVIKNGCQYLSWLNEALSSRILYSLHYWFHEPMLRTIRENVQGNCSITLSRCKPYFVVTTSMIAEINQ